MLSKNTLKVLCLVLFGVLVYEINTIFNLDYVVQQLNKTTLKKVVAKGVIINQQENGKYAVWMFPFPPMKTETALLSHDETLICAYAHACEAFKSHKKINLRELTSGTYYYNYVRDQSFHKVRHMNDFPYHIQAITMLGLLKSSQGKCIFNACILLNEQFMMTMQK